MANYSESVIREVVTEMGLNIPIDDVLENLKAASKKAKEVEAKAKAEKLYQFEGYNTFPELPHGVKVIDFLRTKIRDMGLSDYFDYDSDDPMPDEGDDTHVLVSIGGKMYNVYIHAEAEWISDWSMRCNVAGDISIESVVEITEFELEELKDNYVLIKVKQEWLEKR